MDLDADFVRLWSLLTDTERDALTDFIENKNTNEADFGEAHDLAPSGFAGQ